VASAKDSELGAPQAEPGIGRVLVPVSPARGLLARRRDVGGQRRRWTRRAAGWDRAAAGNPGLVAVVEAVVAEARGEAWMEAIDLGCGSGQLSIPLARRVASVHAVDISPAMIHLLDRNAADAGLANIRSQTAALEDLALPPACADLIVSSYALHHLRDDAKARLVRAAAQWLRPGGRLVIGDMMFGRGADARDRAIIRDKVAQLARRGPAGWWRVAKNAARFTLRTSERPLPVHAWVELLERAGFAEVGARHVVAEAALVHGRRPAAAP
jgi:SAM-dependent methyltransferase